jgi:hypothetical protein
MALYTQEQYDALIDAIAQGVLRVEYADKRIEYRSLDDMERLLKKMGDSLGLNGNTAKSGRTVGNFTKGL